MIRRDEKINPQNVKAMENLRILEGFLDPRFKVIKILPHRKEPLSKH